jgi:hypothetical protein
MAGPALNVREVDSADGKSDERSDERSDESRPPFHVSLYLTSMLHKSSDKAACYLYCICKRGEFLSEE